MKQKNNFRYILAELGRHLPFSIFGVALGIIMMGVLTFLAILMRAEDRLADASKELFHVFHPTHILFSAVATTAMFWKHEKRLVKAVIVGLVGSLGICALSDIYFPFFGGLLLGEKMHMHVCLIEHPHIVLPFAFSGVIAGLLIAGVIERSTEYSHSMHVFISSAASILYLTAYGLQDWIHAAGGVFLVTIIAVMVPCCTSDIVFPLTCVHRNCDHD